MDAKIHQAPRANNTLLVEQEAGVKAEIGRPEMLVGARCTLGRNRRNLLSTARSSACSRHVASGVRLHKEKHRRAYAYVEYRR